MKKATLKKKIKKVDLFRSNEVIVYRGWFSGLYKLAQKYEKNPTELNKTLLLGYISSAEFTISNLIK